MGVGQPSRPYDGELIEVERKPPFWRGRHEMGELFGITQQLFELYPGGHGALIEGDDSPADVGMRDAGSVTDGRYYPILGHPAGPSRIGGYELDPSFIMNDDCIESPGVPKLFYHFGHDLLAVDFVGAPGVRHTEQHQVGRINRHLISGNLESVDDRF